MITSEEPIADHERDGAGDAQPQRDLPTGEFMGAMIVALVGGGQFRAVAFLIESLDERGNVTIGVGSPMDRGRAGIEADRDAANAGDGLDGIGHVARTIAARHAADEQFGGGATRGYRRSF